MTVPVLAPFDQIASAWRETAEETARTLTTAELAIFPNLFHDATEVRAALFQAYTRDELLASLLAADVFGLDRHLCELHHHTFGGCGSASSGLISRTWPTSGALGNLGREGGLA